MCSLNFNNHTGISVVTEYIHGDSLGEGYDKYLTDGIGADHGEIVMTGGHG